MIVGAVLVVVAVVAVVVVVVGSGGSTATTPPPLPAPGRILAYDEKSGQLVIERPDGRQRVLDRHLLTGRPNASPDGRYIVTDSGGELFVIRGGRIVKRRSPLPDVGTDGSIFGQPFADDDRWALAPNTFSSTTLTLVPLAGGRTRSLGEADAVAADPAAPGIYVSVGTGRSVPLPSDTRIQVQPDVRVERRIIGKPTRTIVTAAQLDRLAQLPPSVKLMISVTPSPHGRDVLVWARSLAAGQPRTLLAVFEPNGHLVDHVAGAHIAGGYWSPDDTRIAYTDSQPNRMILWQPAAHSTRSIAIPASAMDVYSCVWSLDQVWVACASGHVTLRPGPSRRLLVDVNGGRTETTSSSDEPLIWLTDPVR